jgi:peptide/nickel transport system ATP-binding protein
MDGPMSAIRAEGLDVRFGDIHAVRGASFAVAEGESFGIVGESGSGKSTVLRALAGLNPGWTGRIEIRGEAQGRRRTRAFHAAVQMVFQDPFGSLHPRHTVDRALVLEPRILLLDEPTSALDVSIQAEVLNLLAELRQRRGLTYVLVSHNLAVVGHMCQRVAVMNAGRIVEELDAASLRAGTPREAYTRQLLAASRGYDRAAAAGFRSFD